MKGVKDSELIVVDGKIYHLGLAPEQLADQIIVVGDPARADLVAEFFDETEHEVQHREYVTRTGKYNGMPVSVVATGIGTDNSEINLIETEGLKNFDLETKVMNDERKSVDIIRVGTSGGPQEHIKEGTLAISRYALGLDNTGLFYDTPAVDDVVVELENQAYNIITDATPEGARFKGRIHPYASKANNEIADALWNNAPSERVQGITGSASGFFAPQGRQIPGVDITVPYLQEVLADNLEVDGMKLVNIEMESSLNFHLGNQLGYRMGTICPIIANRRTGQFLEDYSGAVNTAIDVALKSLNELYEMKK